MQLEHAKLTVTPAGVATLQIDNGTSLNILNSSTIAELTATLRTLARDNSIRALIIRGTGDKAFIGGADINELAKLNPDTAIGFITRLHDLIEAVRDFPAPTIARLAGWCMGGGMELAAVCDIRIGTMLSNFAMPEVRIGIPSVIHANVLARLIGEGHTRWLLLTGAAMNAEQALKWGFMNDMVEPEAIDDAIDHVVSEILECGPGGVRAQKALLRTWEDPNIERGLKESIAMFSKSYETSEPAEYMQHFFDRKKKK